MKYAISFYDRTRNYISGREVIRELEDNKNEYFIVYYRHPITNQLYPLIYNDEDFSLKVYDSFAFCTNEMIKYLKKRKAHLV